MSFVYLIISGYQGYQWGDVRNPTSNQCDRESSGEQRWRGPGAGGGRCPPRGGGEGGGAGATFIPVTARLAQTRRGYLSVLRLAWGWWADWWRGDVGWWQIWRKSSSDLLCHCGQHPAPPADTAHRPALSLTIPRREIVSCPVSRAPVVRQRRRHTQYSSQTQPVLQQTEAFPLTCHISWRLAHILTILLPSSPRLLLFLSQSKEKKRTNLFLVIEKILEKSNRTSVRENLGSDLSTWQRSSRTTWTRMTVA